LKAYVINYKPPLHPPLLREERDEWLLNGETDNPFKVLVTTMLSARTNDKTTSEVSEKLFLKIKNLEDIEKFSPEDIEKLIYPVGFYKNKARYLKQLPQVIKNEFNNKIPDTVDDLVKLPGVGRKTANLVVAIAFKKPAVCVDVHVHRIMNRIGYVVTKTPFETEMVLREKLPVKYWMTINFILVGFGQNLCRPLSPHCSICPIKDYLIKQM